MQIPVLGATSLSSVQVTWSALTGNDNGGSAIDSYLLETDGGVPGNPFVMVQGAAGSYSTALSYSTSSSAGAIHQFRVSAHNVHGWGPVSNVLSIQAAAVPGTPNQVVTSIINRSARIAWSEPSTNYKAITKYQIEIKSLAGGTYHTELT
jgi:hypothetical protein